MKKMLFLLLALIFVAPAWAVDAATAAAKPVASEEAKPAVKGEAKPAAKPAKKKKMKKKGDIKPQACSVQTCGGVQGCYQAKCGAACPGGCG